MIRENVLYLNEATIEVGCERVVSADFSSEDTYSDIIKAGPFVEMMKSNEFTV